MMMETLLLLIVVYPSIDAVIVYVPGGTFKMKYSPFKSDTAPIFNDLMTMVALMSGSPLALSVTRPEIFPVFPAAQTNEKNSVIKATVAKRFVSDPDKVIMRVVSLSTTFLVIINFCAL